MGVGFLIRIADDVLNQYKLLAQAVAHNGMDTGMGHAIEILAT